MEAHKAKMSALTQEFEELQLQLQALGPQKLRGSTASLTTSSVAEDLAENISGSSETEENPNQHQEEKDTDAETKHQEEETKDNEPIVTQPQDEKETKDIKPEVTQPQDEETKDEPEVTDELTT